jgi:hypothetical protein
VGFPKPEGVLESLWFSLKFLFKFVDLLLRLLAGVGEDQLSPLTRSLLLTHLENVSEYCMRIRSPLPSPLKIG